MIPRGRKNNGKIFKVIHEERQIADQVMVASGFFSRMKGLLGVEKLGMDSGIWIVPCTSIHMFFMKIPLDVVFIDKKGVITAICHQIKPWRLSRYHPEAFGVLELAAGKATRVELKVGDRLDFQENTSSEQ
ncbi:MAG: DUF192 domain-containing protein [Deltaproteobacteria bacterium]|jgi:uncharacterized membrane protein (UPF0127 family)|nr:DUF192 domain-containing protein [Deltaproteobacteria bacterium]